MYTADNIFPVITTIDLINEDSDPTTPFKLATGMRPSVLHLRVLFCPYVVQKATAHVGTKGLTMSLNAKRFLWYLRLNITSPKMECFYVPHKHKIISLYDVVFDETFSSALAYTSQLY